MLFNGLLCLLFCIKTVDVMLFIYAKSNIPICIHYYEFISFLVQAKNFRKISVVSVTPNKYQCIKGIFTLIYRIIRP